MADAVAVLQQNGLDNAGVIVQAAQAEGLELAKAAVLCQKESNGKNVWGHDAVNTGGCYTKGAPVTVQAYWAYRKSPTAGWQGIGPTQLTYKGFIYQAEAMNPAEGAADPLTNCRIGFRNLVQLQKAYGDQDGARRYNGSGSAAEAYGRDFMAKLGTWRQRLSGATTDTGGVPPAVGALPTITQGNVNSTVWKVQTFLNKTFPSYAKIDAGPGPTSTYGPQTVAVVKEFQARAGVTGADADGTTIGPRTWAALVKFGYK
jgi:hypothetical protein